MEARAAYRHVLRAASIAFQGPSTGSIGAFCAQSSKRSWLMVTPSSWPTGDVPLLQSARIQARTTFVQHRTLDGPAAAEQITHAEDVARILRQNIVQAQRTDVGGEERWSECHVRWQSTLESRVADAWARSVLQD